MLRRDPQAYLSDGREGWAKPISQVALSVGERLFPELSSDIVNHPSSRLGEISASN